MIWLAVFLLGGLVVGVAAGSLIVVSFVVMVGLASLAAVLLYEVLRLFVDALVWLLWAMFVWPFRRRA